jgi:hypothetical protein
MNHRSEVAWEGRGLRKIRRAAFVLSEILVGGPEHEGVLAVVVVGWSRVIGAPSDDHGAVYDQDLVMAQSNGGRQD